MADEKDKEVEICPDCGKKYKRKDKDKNRAVLKAKFFVHTCRPSTTVPSKDKYKLEKSGD